MSRALRRSGVHLDATRAFAYLDTMDERIEVALEFAFDALVPMAEAYMRANAPWTDRTTLARASLNAHVEGGGREISLVLAHGVDYGIYLETMQDGRYAIIGPAQRHMATEARRVVAASVNAALRVG